MNPSSIYWLDKNVGQPLCCALTFHSRFREFLNKNNSRSKEVSKIIFIKLIEQGSTVLAFSALKEAAAMVGKENVYFMAFKENRFILDLLDVVPPGNVIEIDHGNLNKFVFSVVKAIARARREKIDAVVDMEFFSRASAILSYLIRASKRAGLHLFTCEGPYRGNLFTHKLLYNPYLHTSQLFASLVEALNHDVPSQDCPMSIGIPAIKSDLPKIIPGDDEKKSLIQMIERLKHSCLTRPVIILNPNASDLLPIRKWPEENYIKLGKMLLTEFNEPTIIITGAPPEKAKADIIASEIGTAVSLAGHTSLHELITLYSIADVLVTNDSGPAHFSSLTGIKSVILFGPETPLLYGPLNQNGRVITPALSCSPCVNVFNHRKAPCRHGDCLKRIMPEEVFENVKDLLSGEAFNHLNSEHSRGAPI